DTGAKLFDEVPLGAGSLAARALDPVDIEAGTERRGRARDHHGSYLLARLDPVELVDQPLDQLRRQRVPALRAVPGQPGDSPRFVDDQLVRHRGSTSCGGKPASTRTSRVCWPSDGAGRGGCCSTLEILTGLPIMRIRPSWTIMPRAAT